jgi:cytochrome b subunit of formate dehydrogenase
MNMRIQTPAIRTMAATLVLFGAVMLPSGLASAAAGAETLDNAGCLSCHSDKQKKLTVRAADGKPRTLQAIANDRFLKGVHGEMTCVACHQDIADNKSPHKKTGAPKANCASCHEAVWEKVKEQKLTVEKSRLGLVVENIGAYKQSFHARANEDDPSRPNAYCDNCHDTHYFNVPPLGTSKRTDWHLTIPKVCGEQCHADQLEAYNSSVHAVEVREKKNPKAAVCTDCHTAHSIGSTSLRAFKQLIVHECGSCHKENYRTYTDTYHGQVSQLGDTHTASCYNCHGSHEIRKADDAESMVHPDNRLATCQECHDGKKMPKATAGFASFGPHAHANDFERYPQMWIASRFMLALLAGVFAFFWLHSGLWYYREWQDRKHGVPRPFVRTAGLAFDESRHVRRFGAVWRAAHLLFALVTMTLVLTGTAALYAESIWAPAVAKAVGGARNLAFAHRVSATVFLGIFLLHLVYVMQHLLRKKGFRWFGPDSLLPRWQDLTDCWGMFKWFLGKGPRPSFDRWAYYEKFDYWAVFWGVTVIGGSGLMLAYPHVTAALLPGWVFNVATLVHGEEAFLAAVFLFTVHFFNNHFRPDKLPPPDVVMFTGTQSLAEFRHDHPAHYNRLLESGELEKYLVGAPSRPMALGSKILGLTLIAIGLILLVLVVSGFVNQLLGR